MPNKSTLDATLARLRGAGLTLWVSEGQLHYRAPRGLLTDEMLETLRNSKHEIIKRLTVAEHFPALPAIAARPRAHHAPLSIRQRDHWAYQREGRISDPWIIETSIRIQGELDMGALARSLDFVSRRHEALRTRIVEQSGEVVQIIDSPGAVSLRVIDLGISKFPEADVAARQMLEAFIRERVTLAYGPLFRACVIKVSDQNHILTFVIDHLVSDAHSMALLHSELAAAYRAFVRCVEPCLPCVSLQFADYAHWERESLPNILAHDRPYWIAALVGARPLVLPTDRPRPRKTFATASIRFQLCTPEISNRLRQLALRVESTLSVLTIAGCAALLWRLSGQDDFVMRNTVTSRLDPALDNTVGFLLNHVLLRVTVGKNPSYLDFVEIVHERVLEAYSHSVAPFSSLAESIEEIDMLPLAETFGVNFIVVEGTPAGPSQGAETFPDVVAAPFSLSVDNVTQMEIALNVEQVGERLFGYLLYSTDLFEQQTAERLASGLTDLLSRVSADPSQAM